MPHGARGTQLARSAEKPRTATTIISVGASDAATPKRGWLINVYKDATAVLPFPPDNDPVSPQVMQRVPVSTEAVASVSVSAISPAASSASSNTMRC